jgi:hypothetical protein
MQKVFMVFLCEEVCTTSSSPPLDFGCICVDCKLKDFGCRKDGSFVTTQSPTKPIPCRRHKNKNITPPVKPRRDRCFYDCVRDTDLYITPMTIPFYLSMYLLEIQVEILCDFGDFKKFFRVGQLLTEVLCLVLKF